MNPHSLCWDDSWGTEPHRKEVFQLAQPWAGLSALVLLWLCFPEKLISALGRGGCPGHAAWPRTWVLSFPALQLAVGKQEEVVICLSCYQMTAFSAEPFFLSLMMAAKQAARLGWWPLALSCSLRKDFRSISCVWACPEPTLQHNALSGRLGASCPPGQAVAQFPAPLPQTPSAKLTPACLTAPHGSGFRAQVGSGGRRWACRRCRAHAAHAVCVCLRVPVSICPPRNSPEPAG